MKNLNHDENGLPLYYQLKEILKEKIEGGEWSPGDQIPNEIQLASDYKISRSTVRQAILDLVREGLLNRKQGKGTFVAAPKVEGNFISFRFPLEWGTKHVPLSLREIRCSPSIASSLHIVPNEKVYEILRLRYFKEETEPSVLEKSYLRIDPYPDFLSHNFEGRVFDLLAEKYNVHISKTKTFIEPVLLSAYEAQVLEVMEGQPALKLTKLGMDAQGNPIILNKSIFRGDRCRLLFYSEDL
ncbi:GntR family transcriptional regulator [Ammoniphilus sp. YIM 78166]|uniref:GntR family transcriptional regulator n=1 Tax=Ammoniphilus sp. YIM 78166 TaxID=1644106 RepID=UPI00106F6759|nr:GntR family transcriptional regulator [Ammoniphilus sp. YIM 78166]